MIKKFLVLNLTALLFLGIFSFSPGNVYAGAAGTITGEGFFNSAVSGAGIKEKVVSKATLAKRVGDMIKLVLYFLGTIILVFIIYAGILWLTAGGNAEKVKTAQKILYNAVIGAVIIGAAYSITAVILLLS